MGDNVITNESNKEELEVRKILQDLRILARDINDFRESYNIKKKIEKYERVLQSLTR